MSDHRRGNLDRSEPRIESGQPDEHREAAGMALQQALLHRKILQRKAARKVRQAVDGEQAMSQATAAGGEVPYRAEMEHAFGQDFSGVRAAAGQQEHMHALGAQAATAGERVAFASASPSKELVAHELTHVVQQRAGAVAAPQGKGAVIDPDPGLEAEADAVGAQVAQGGRAVVASARGGGAVSASGGGEIQRKPDISQALPWDKATQVKQFDDHPVFKISFPDGPVVIKAQAAVTSAKEVLGDRLAQNLLPGVTTAGTRLLDAEEKKAFYQSMGNVPGGKAIKGDADLAIMEYMEGSDLGEGGHLIKEEGEKHPGQEGIERAGNISELLAFNFFIQGSDRFHVDLPGTSLGGLERNDNIRLDKHSTKVQAIDNTIRPGLQYGLKKDANQAAEDYQHAIEPLFDNLIFDEDGDSKLIRLLENQLHVGDMGQQGRSEMRSGFARALDSIGNSKTDFSKLLVSIAPPEVIAESPLLGVRDPNERGYTDFLDSMRAFFKKKSQMFETVTQAQQGGTQADILAVTSAATRLEVGDPLGTLSGTIQTFDRPPSKAHGGAKGKKLRKPQWPAGLAQMEKDKDEKINKLKKISKDTARDVLANIITTGAQMLAVTDAGLWEDFCRIGAKMVLHMDGKIT